MTNIEPAASGRRSLAHDLLSAARYYLGGRTGIILLVVAGLGAGAWFNWGWLIAIGLVPVLISVLPCAAMCALGLCMRGGSRSPPIGPEQSSEPSAEKEGIPSLGLVGGGIADTTKDSRQGQKGCC